MQSFETPVLLRLARSDDLDPDAELEDPHRELGQPRWPGGCERRSTIGPNRGRQTKLEKRGIEDLSDVLDVGIEQPFAAEQIARERVDQRQRIAPHSGGGQEPALEIDAPDIVRRVTAAERSRHAE